MLTSAALSARRAAAGRACRLACEMFWIDLFEPRARREPGGEDRVTMIPGQFPRSQRPRPVSVDFRGFCSMPSRFQALASFFAARSGRDAVPTANATMIDSDDVPAASAGGSAGQASRPPRSRRSRSVTAPPHPIAHTGHTFLARRAVRPGVFRLLRPPRPVQCSSRTKSHAAGILRQSTAENTFPALPVRASENVFMRLACLPSTAHLSSHLRQIRTLQQLAGPHASRPVRDRRRRTTAATARPSPPAPCCA